MSLNAAVGLAPLVDRRVALPPMTRKQAWPRSRMTSVPGRDPFGDLRRIGSDGRTVRAPTDPRLIPSEQLPILTFKRAVVVPVLFAVLLFVEEPVPVKIQFVARGVFLVGYTILRCVDIYTIRDIPFR